MRWTLSIIRKALHDSFHTGEGIRLRCPDGRSDHITVRPDGTIVMFAVQPGWTDHAMIYYQEDLDAVARAIYQRRKDIVAVSGRRIRD